MILSPVEQGSDAWLAMRRKYITSTDAAVILGVDPWTTPYQLMMRKRDLLPEQQVNERMIRGRDLEPIARDAYIAQTGHPMIPVCVLHENGWLMASLDGMDDTLTQAVEIKCPGEENHRMALDGVIPENYFVQCQQQLACCNNQISLDYWSFDGKQGVCLPVEPNLEIQARILEEGKAFYDLMMSGEMPPLTERDYVARDDDLYQLSVYRWMAAKEGLEQAKKLESDAREDLIRLCEHQNTKGCGISLRRSVRKGDVDFRSVPELFGVDLDQYRKEPIITWTIRKTEDGRYGKG